MIVLCHKEGCGKRYDDAKCWTICPHNPLDGPMASRDQDPAAGYCREHDLYGCPFHADSPGPTDAYGIADTRRGSIEETPRPPLSDPDGGRRGD